MTLEIEEYPTGLGYPSSVFKKYDPQAFAAYLAEQIEINERDRDQSNR